MSALVFRCYAYGTRGDWQAICIDLDIAVQGKSFSEVRNLLNDAVTTYVEDATNEQPAVANQLINRSAPWFVRAKLAYVMLKHMLRRERKDDQLTGSFDIPCHA